ncbi:2487_t:CDS:2, partial [Paraglomus occultum]
TALSENCVNIENLKKALPKKILLIHGDKDYTVPVEATLQFHQVLLDLKIEGIRLCQYPGMNHEDPVVVTKFAPSPLPDASTTIAYEDTGEEAKPAILLVPGLGDARQSYRFIAPKLHRDGRYRIIVMDLRGAGESSVGFSSYTPEDVAGDMIAVLNHARVVKPAVLVGHSLSAASANIVAVKHPDRVQGIVILNGLVRDLPADKYFRPICGPLFSSFWGASVWIMYWKSLFTDQSKKPADLEEYATSLKEMLQEKGKLAVMVAFIKATKEPAWKLVPEVQAPVLLIYGDKDPDFSDAAAEPMLLEESYKKSSKIEAFIIEGLGHYPVSDKNIVK